MQTWYDRLYSRLKDRLATYSFNTYYIGVSGGRDSVFLFHLIKQLIPQSQLVVLHLNHGLRGAFSDQDQAFVETLAKENNIRCISAKMKIEALPNNGGLENLARQVRYQWFKEKMEKNASLLFCGHSLDDHLETMLMKIHRGAGLAGLKGIAYFQSIFGISLCRPLLTVERRQITEYLSENNLPWCDDQTNFSLEYFRNNIRLNAMPQLSNDTKKNLLKLSVLSNHLQSFFNLPEALLINNGLEFNFETISNLSNFEFRFLVEKIYQYFDLPSGPSKKHMIRMADFFLKNASHIELSNFIHLYRWQNLLFFNNENSQMQNNPKTFVSFESSANFHKSDSLTFQLSSEYFSQITWRIANLEEDCWRGRPLVKHLKKVRLPPWRKCCILVCEWQGIVVFISYFGVTENYERLISESKDLVKIETFCKKIKL